MLNALIGAIFGLVAGFIAASDKNRVELYKRKLDAYEKIIDQVQSIIMIVSLERKGCEFDDKSFFLNMMVELTQLRLSKRIYISKEFHEELGNLYNIMDMETDAMFSLFSEIVGHATKDLHIKNHNAITAVTALELSMLRKASTTTQESAGTG